MHAHRYTGVEVKGLNKRVTADDETKQTPSSLKLNGRIEDRQAIMTQLTL
jgi:hypothetical protein